MMIIPENFISEFLNIVLINNSFIFLNLWSVVHFFSGVILSLLVRNIYIVFILLVLYEIFEFLFYGILFRPETKIDILWDLIIGLIGFIIFARGSLNTPSKQRQKLRSST